MGKNLFIAEKPSVAMEFAKALDMHGARHDGYLEDDDNIVTWCVGHLIGMSYPEKYDPSLKSWELETLPFLPTEYKYEVLAPTSKQYKVVKELLNRKDVSCIYYSGDSAREGEYIQRLVRQMAGHNPAAAEKRVWIDSQTKAEILKGIQTAKDLSAYNTLSDSAYARAIEDYDIGINFSRALSIKYANQVYNAAGEKRGAIAVGRVMSCVLGMVVRREREIRNSVKTVYYTVSGNILDMIDTDWKPKKGSPLYKEEDLYNMSGFLKKENADAFVAKIDPSLTFKKATFTNVKKYAPLLFNLAELQGECTKKLHISPDETLSIAQSLYEKKLTTYPRTDARVLTTAIDAVIDQNITGLSSIALLSSDVNYILTSGSYKTIDQTKYTNDAAVSDHYAIIPTGELTELNSLSDIEREVYIMICRRFLSIFMPPAEFVKMNAEFETSGELFTASGEDLMSPGWLVTADKVPDTKKAHNMIAAVKTLTQGQQYPAVYTINTAETKPPSRYTTGSMVLAMENAGKLIEDEELREQIKGSGIGTSATRAETIKKLISINYISANKKTQVITPTLLGEAIYEIIDICAQQMLSPEITASWEKGLTQIVDGTVTKDLYLDKMYAYIYNITTAIKGSSCGEEFSKRITEIQKFYPKVTPIQAGPVMTDFTCPNCGKPMRKLSTGAYTCSGYPDCKYAVWNNWCGKKIPDKQMEVLMAGKTTSEIKGFESKAGKKFSAKLKLENGKITPVFSQK